MINEININGVFISPLLLCLALAFPTRMLISKWIEYIKLYQFIAQRPAFDTALFLILTGGYISLLEFIYQ